MTWKTPHKGLESCWKTTNHQSIKTPNKGGENIQDKKTQVLAKEESSKEGELLKEWELESLLVPIAYCTFIHLPSDFQFNSMLGWNGT